MGQEKHFYLIQRESDLKSIKFDRSPVILPLADTLPYFTNLQHIDERISQWEDFGIATVKLSHYSCRLYPHVSEHFNNWLSLRNLNEPIYQSPHFQFMMIRNLGRDFFAFLEIMGNFFKENKPEVIYSNHQSDIVNETLTALCELHSCDKLPLK